MRAVIVDDEELARGFLREMLAAHPEIEIVAECANGFEAVKAIGEIEPDLVFLDVQMPKLDGFEVLELTFFFFLFLQMPKLDGFEVLDLLEPRRRPWSS